MKIIKFIILFTIVTLAFSSCKKEKEKSYREPIITWEGSEFTRLSFRNSNEQNIDLNVTFTSEAGIKKIRVFENKYDENEKVISFSELAGPSNYSGQHSFSYVFTKKYYEADFNGIASLGIYFEVTDNVDQATTKIYSISKSSENPDEKKYIVSFGIYDKFGFMVEDAIVKFNGITNEANNYQFINILPGTYDYEISKSGFIGAGGKVVVVNEDVNVQIELLQDNLEF